MTTPLYAAIGTVVKLIQATRMGMREACRIAAWQHGCDADHLYRELTQ